MEFRGTLHWYLRVFVDDTTSPLGVPLLPALPSLEAALDANTRTGAFLATASDVLGLTQAFKYVGKGKLPDLADLNGPASNCPATATPVMVRIERRKARSLQTRTLHCIRMQI